MANSAQNINQNLLNEISQNINLIDRDENGAVTSREWIDAGLAPEEFKKIAGDSDTISMALLSQISSSGASRSSDASAATKAATIQEEQQTQTAQSASASGTVFEVGVETACRIDEEIEEIMDDLQEIQWYRELDEAGFEGYLVISEEAVAMLQMYQDFTQIMAMVLMIIDAAQAAQMALIDVLMGLQPSEPSTYDKNKRFKDRMRMLSDAFSQLQEIVNQRNDAVLREQLNVVDQEQAKYGLKLIGMVTFNGSLADHELQARKAGMKAEVYARRQRVDEMNAEVIHKYIEWMIKEKEGSQNYFDMMEVQILEQVNSDALRVEAGSNVYGQQYDLNKSLAAALITAMERLNNLRNLYVEIIKKRAETNLMILEAYIGTKFNRKALEYISDFIGEMGAYVRSMVAININRTNILLSTQNELAGATYEQARYNALYHSNLLFPFFDLIDAPTLALFPKQELEPSVVDYGEVDNYLRQWGFGGIDGQSGGLFGDIELRQMELMAELEYGDATVTDVGDGYEGLNYERASEILNELDILSSTRELLASLARSSFDTTNMVLYAYLDVGYSSMGNAITMAAKTRGDTVFQIARLKIDTLEKSIKEHNRQRKYEVEMERAIKDVIGAVLGIAIMALAAVITIATGGVGGAMVIPVALAIVSNGMGLGQQIADLVFTLTHMPTETPYEDDDFFELDYQHGVASVEAEYQRIIDDLSYDESVYFEARENLGGGTRQLNPEAVIEANKALLAAYLEELCLIITVTSAETHTQMVLEIMGVGSMPTHSRDLFDMANRRYSTFKEILDNKVKLISANIANHNKYVNNVRDAIRQSVQVLFSAIGMVFSVGSAATSGGTSRMLTLAGDITGLVSSTLDLVYSAVDAMPDLGELESIRLAINEWVSNEINELDEDDPFYGLYLEELNAFRDIDPSTMLVDIGNGYISANYVALSDIQFAMTRIYRLWELIAHIKEDQKATIEKILGKSLGDDILSEATNAARDKAFKWADSIYKFWQGYAERHNEVTDAKRQLAQQIISYLINLVFTIDSMMKSIDKKSNGLFGKKFNKWSNKTKNMVTWAVIKYVITKIIPKLLGELINLVAFSPAANIPAVNTALPSGEAGEGIAGLDAAQQVVGRQSGRAQIVSQQIDYKNKIIDQLWSEAHDVVTGLIKEVIYTRIRQKDKEKQEAKAKKKGMFKKIIGYIVKVISLVASFLGPIGQLIALAINVAYGAATGGLKGALMAVASFVAGQALGGVMDAVGEALSSTASEAAQAGAQQATEAATALSDTASQLTNQASQLTQQASQLTEQASQLTQQASQALQSGNPVQAGQLAEQASKLTQEASRLTEQAQSLTSQAAELNTAAGELQKQASELEKLAKDADKAQKAGDVKELAKVSEQISNTIAQMSKTITQVSTSINAAVAQNVGGQIGSETLNNITKQMANLSKSLKSLATKAQKIALNNAAKVKEAAARQSAGKETAGKPDSTTGTSNAPATTQPVSQSFSSNVARNISDRFKSLFDTSIKLASTAQILEGVIGLILSSLIEEMMPKILEALGIDEESSVFLRSLAGSIAQGALTLTAQQFLINPAVSAVFKGNGTIDPKFIAQKIDKNNPNMTKAEAIYKELEANGYIDSEGNITDKFVNNVKTSRDLALSNLSAQDVDVAFNAMSEKWMESVKGSGKFNIYNAEEFTEAVTNMLINAVKTAVVNQVVTQMGIKNKAMQQLVGGILSDALDLAYKGIKNGTLTSEDFKGLMSNAMDSAVSALIQVGFNQIVKNRYNSNDAQASIKESLYKDFLDRQLSSFEGEIVKSVLSADAYQDLKVSMIGSRKGDATARLEQLGIVNIDVPENVMNILVNSEVFMKALSNLKKAANPALAVSAANENSYNYSGALGMINIKVNEINELLNQMQANDKKIDPKDVMPLFRAAFEEVGHAVADSLNISAVSLDNSRLNAELFARTFASKCVEGMTATPVIEEAYLDQMAKAGDKIAQFLSSNKEALFDVRPNGVLAVKPDAVNIVKTLNPPQEIAPLVEAAINMDKIVNDAIGGKTAVGKQESADMYKQTTTITKADLKALAPFVTDDQLPLIFDNASDDKMTFKKDLKDILSSSDNKFSLEESVRLMSISNAVSQGASIAFSDETADIMAMSSYVQNKDKAPVEFAAVLSSEPAAVAEKALLISNLSMPSAKSEKVIDEYAKAMNIDPNTVKDSLSDLFMDIAQNQKDVQKHIASQIISSFSSQTNTEDVAAQAPVVASRDPQAAKDAFLFKDLPMKPPSADISRVSRESVRQFATVSENSFSSSEIANIENYVEKMDVQNMSKQDQNIINLSVGIKNKTSKAEMASILMKDPNEELNEIKKPLLILLDKMPSDISKEQKSSIRSSIATIGVSEKADVEEFKQMILDISALAQKSKMPPAVKAAVSDQLNKAADNIDLIIVNVKAKDIAEKAVSQASKTSQIKEVADIMMSSPNLVKNTSEMIPKVFLSQNPSINQNNIEQLTTIVAALNMIKEDDISVQAKASIDTSINRLIGSLNKEMPKPVAVNMPEESAEVQEISSVVRAEAEKRVAPNSMVNAPKDISTILPNNVQPTESVAKTSGQIIGSSNPVALQVPKVVDAAQRTSVENKIADMARETMEKIMPAVAQAQMPAASAKFMPGSQQISKSSSSDATAVTDDVFTPEENVQIEEEVSAAVDRNKVAKEDLTLLNTIVGIKNKALGAERMSSEGKDADAQLNGMKKPVEQVLIKIEGKMVKAEDKEKVRELAKQVKATDFTKAEEVEDIMSRLKEVVRGANITANVKKVIDKKIGQTIEAIENTGNNRKVKDIAEEAVKTVKAAVTEEQMNEVVQFVMSKPAIADKVVRMLPVLMDMEKDKTIDDAEKVISLISKIKESAKGKSDGFKVDIAATKAISILNKTIKSLDKAQAEEVSAPSVTAKTEKSEPRTLADNKINDNYVRRVEDQLVVLAKNRPEEAKKLVEKMVVTALKELKNNETDITVDLMSVLGKLSKRDDVRQVSPLITKVAVDGLKEVSEQILIQAATGRVSKQDAAKAMEILPAPVILDSIDKVPAKLGSQVISKMSETKAKEVIAYAQETGKAKEAIDMARETMEKIMPAVAQAQMPAASAKFMPGSQQISKSSSSDATAVTDDVFTPEENVQIEEEVSAAVDRNKVAKEDLTLLNTIVGIKNKALGAERMSSEGKDADAQLNGMKKPVEQVLIKIEGKMVKAEDKEKVRELAKQVKATDFTKAEEVEDIMSRLKEVVSEANITANVKKVIDKKIGQTIEAIENTGNNRKVKDIAEEAVKMVKAAVAEEQMNEVVQFVMSKPAIADKVVRMLPVIVAAEKNMKPENVEKTIRLMNEIKSAFAGKPDGMKMGLAAERAIAIISKQNNRLFVTVDSSSMEPSNIKTINIQNVSVGEMLRNSSENIAETVISTILADRMNPKQVARFISNFDPAVIAIILESLEEKDAMKVAAEIIFASDPKLAKHMLSDTGQKKIGKKLRALIDSAIGEDASLEDNDSDINVSGVLNGKSDNDGKDGQEEKDDKEEIDIPISQG